ncbi:hypothetical protein CPAV1605_1483 [seawater metagenome]|uniref:Uncharacterized protein n=1 Tax=seawater metagenome TaxID=1561972 RepID=A0A5E8CK62_9ZZZZ
MILIYVFFILLMILLFVKKYILNKTFSLTNGISLILKIFKTHGMEKIIILEDSNQKNIQNFIKTELKRSNFDYNLVKEDKRFISLTHSYDLCNEQIPVIILFDIYSNVLEYIPKRSIVLIVSNNFINSPKYLYIHKSNDITLNLRNYIDTIKNFKSTKLLVIPPYLLQSEFSYALQLKLLINKEKKNLDLKDNIIIPEEYFLISEDKNYIDLKSDEEKICIQNNDIKILKKINLILKINYVFMGINDVYDFTPIVSKDRDFNLKNIFKQIYKEKSLLVISPTCILSTEILNLLPVIENYIFIHYDKFNKGVFINTSSYKSIIIIKMNGLINNLVSKTQIVIKNSSNNRTINIHPFEFFRELYYFIVENNIMQIDFKKENKEYLLLAHNDYKSFSDLQQLYFIENLELISFMNLSDFLRVFKIENHIKIITDAKNFEACIDSLSDIKIKKLKFICFVHNFNLLKDEKNYLENNNYNLLNLDLINYYNLSSFNIILESTKRSTIVFFKKFN